jgi:mono/diheme cytochrome c family protein
MLQQSVRRLRAILAISDKLRPLVAVLLGLTIGCSARANEPVGDGDEVALGQRYALDAQYRRQVLVTSLVSPDNTYARQRLQHYEESDWGALPEWNPRCSPVAIDDAGRPPPSNDAVWSKLEIESVPWEAQALVDLGRRAFFRYPLQTSPYLRQALVDADSPSRYGLSVDGSGVSDVVWTELPRGLVEPALTCATCHTAAERGHVVEGKNNALLDIEALVADYRDGSVGGSRRPGRVDVTGDGIDNPTAISDLRAVRSQVNLHRAATLRNGLVPLAIRIETLVIASLDEAVRPPRKLAFALALYLWRLEPEPTRTTDEASSRGRNVFATSCSGCHRPPSFSGPAVPLEIVGTDPSVGLSPERTTGFYRVPSLRGVGDRRRLLATGDVDDLRALFDAQRTVPGHTFGLNLTSDEKEDLLAYLETL